MKFHYYKTIIFFSLALFGSHALAVQTVDDLCGRLWQDKQGDDEQVALRLQEMCVGTLPVTQAFFRAVRLRDTVLLQFLLTDPRVTDIEQAEIENALHRATTAGHQEVIDVLVAHGNIEPITMAEICADAVESEDEETVETMNDVFTQYLRREQLPPAVAIVLAVLFLQYTGQGSF